MIHFLLTLNLIGALVWLVGKTTEVVLLVRNERRDQQRFRRVVGERYGEHA